MIRKLTVLVAALMLLFPVWPPRRRPMARSTP